MLSKSFVNLSAVGLKFAKTAADITQNQINLHGVALCKNASRIISKLRASLSFGKLSCKIGFKRASKVFSVTVPGYFCKITGKLASEKLLISTCHPDAPSFFKSCFH